MALRLPMSAGFDNVRQREGHSRSSPATPRARVKRSARALKMPTDKPIVLAVLRRRTACRASTRPRCRSSRSDNVIMTASAPMQPRRAKGHCRPPSARARSSRINEEAMYDAGVRYEDLVGAAEALVTKPGYGVISECIANDAAVLYTSRGHFPEYDVLVEEMPK